MKKKFSIRTFAKRINTFCAFCKVPRHVYKQKRLSFFDVIVSAIAAVALTFTIFHEVDGRGFLIFLFLLLAGDFFIQIRWRMALQCPHCGFDPVLYLKDQEKAAQKVKAHLEKRQDDPSRWMGPQMHVPARRVPDKKLDLKA